MTSAVRPERTLAHTGAERTKATDVEGHELVAQRDVQDDALVPQRANPGSETDSNLKPLSDYVEAEITSAWQRKTSIETRSFALVTMNLGVATLYFALQTQFGINPQTISPTTRTLLLFSVLGLAVSVVNAAASALPFNYPIPAMAAFDDLLAAAKAGDPDQVEEILESRIKQLKSFTASNSRKVAFMIVSFLAFAAASVLMIFAIVTASAY
jgi:hypothetical protein